MTTERDPRTRIVLSWLHEDAHEDAERVLLRALDEVDATSQHRRSWPVRWLTDMNAFAKLAIAAAAVVVIAVAGIQFLPRSGTSVGHPVPRQPRQPRRPLRSSPRVRSRPADMPCTTVWRHRSRCPRVGKASHHSSGS
jgi:hypothetical protein